MRSGVLRLLTIAAAVTNGGAAAPTAVPRIAAERLEEATAHARQLSQLWTLEHPGQFASIAVKPAIISGIITGAIVDAQLPGASPTIRFSFKTGSAGFGYASFQFYDARGQQNVTLQYGASTERVAGTYTLHTPGSISPYAGPGTYTLADAVVGDSAGNYSFYDASQLSMLFPSITITVKNAGRPDTTVPQLLSGKIDTPTVSLSSSKPLFLASTTVADTVSGVSEMFMSLIDPQGQAHTAYNAAPSPILHSGSLPVGFNLGIFAGNTGLIGTWTIDSVSVHDVAGNSVDASGASNIQKLFGSNTFQVTK